MSQSSRRQFLKLLGVTGGGLVVGIPIQGCASAVTEQADKNVSFQPNAFIQVTPQSKVHFYLPSSEMGQGVYTGLTTLIAEELALKPESVIVHHAPVDEAFKNPLFGVQGTGGSTSMRTRFYPLRQAAATARVLLLEAASQQLSAPVGELQMQHGNIQWQSNVYPIGDFADKASRLPTPEKVTLKKSEDFEFIGQDRPRLDALAKSTGTAVFGIDVETEGLYRAALVRCPVSGGAPKIFKADVVLSMPGVKDVVQIFNGVAVLAETYWQAKQAATALKVEWDLPELSKHSSSTIYQAFSQALDEDEGEQAYLLAEGEKALSQSTTVLEAEYRAPYLAHATMEPLNCTVKLADNSAEIWVGSQNPEAAQGIAAFHSGIDKENISIHSVFLGGGFGRRSDVDYVAEAVCIAKESGLPIQLVWSREDDIRHGHYRPASQVRFKAGLNEQGEITTWSAKRAGPNIRPYLFDGAIDALAPSFIPNAIVDWASKRGYDLYQSWKLDHSSYEGLYEDYDIPNKEVRHVTVDPGLHLGFWRSVGHSFSGFFKESFVDELAQASGKDAVAMRIALSKNDPKLQEVIKIVAERAAWGKSLPKGHFHGVAAHTSFKSQVAEIAEVSVTGGRIKVHKVHCVINCGMAINPNIVKAQMESCIIMGMSAALYGKIDIEQGEVKQSNFHDYPVLRMNESPEINVHIIASDGDPTGVGEPGLPPVAAAIANAVYAATGQRLRQLPLTLSS